MKKNNFLLMVLLFFTSIVSAQWSIDSISAPYSGLTSTQNGTKAIFASASKYEMYDFVTGTWAIQNMIQPRPNVKAATAAGKSYFGGGGFIGIYSYNFFNNVDIYNSSTNTWSTAKLSAARIVGASAAVGNKVLFAGGRQILNYSARVDIFNVNTGAASTYTLSQARTNMAVAVVGTKVIFAGGETGNISNGVYTSSNKVDIFDNATGLWSTALLSVKREQIAVAVVGTKALFAGGLNNSGIGGQYVNVIDIYDAATNTWSTTTMSEGKYGISAITAYSKVYFAGGTINYTGALSNRVEIYNSVTNTMKYDTISSPRISMVAAKTPKRIMFAGGGVVWGNTGTNRVEVLDIKTNKWSVEYLSKPRLNLAAAYYKDKAMFAGGAEVLSSYPQYSIISNRVDIWTDPIARGTNISKVVLPLENSFKVYPNPCKDNLTVQLKTQDFPITASITDLGGRRLKTITFTGNVHTINMADLPKGMYILNLNNAGKPTEAITIIKD